MDSFTKVYFEGDEETIHLFLSMAKEKLGKGINVIDLHPEFKEV